MQLEMFAHRRRKLPTYAYLKASSLGREGQQDEKDFLKYATQRTKSFIIARL